jgi:hypothetical protein
VATSLPDQGLPAERSALQPQQPLTSTSAPDAVFPSAPRKR